MFTLYVNPTSRPFMPNMEISNLAFALPSLYLRFAFGCFRSLSLLRQLCSPLLHVQALQKFPLLFGSAWAARSPRGGSCANVRAKHAYPPTIGCQRYLALGVSLPKFSTYKSGPCLLLGSRIPPKPATADPSSSGGKPDLTVMLKSV